MRERRPDVGAFSAERSGALAVLPRVAGGVALGAQAQLHCLPLHGQRAEVRRQIDLVVDAEDPPAQPGVLELEPSDVVLEPRSTRRLALTAHGRAVLQCTLAACMPPQIRGRPSIPLTLDSVPRPRRARPAPSRARRPLAPRPADGSVALRASAFGRASDGEIILLIREASALGRHYEPPMAWTPSRPERDGWYWWRESAHAEPVAVVIEKGAVYRLSPGPEPFAGASSGHWSEQPIRPPADGRDETARHVAVLMEALGSRSPAVRDWAARLLRRIELRLDAAERRELASLERQAKLVPEHLPAS